MRIELILDSDAKAKLGVSSYGERNVHPKKKNVSRAKYERLSEQDIKELMGVNRDTYKRVNGKIRRK